MGYFRPVMAVNKPASFPIASGISFERGTFLWLNSDAYATTERGSNQPLGIGDDDKISEITAKIQNQVITYSITVTASGGSASYSLGRTIASDSLLSAASAPASWTVTLPSALSGATSTFTLTEDGTLTHTVTGSGLTPGTYSVTLQLDYTYVKSATQDRGMTTVSDMFNNNSTAASQLVGVWFMDGIYESDQYDPYVTYSTGSKLYAKTGGIFTSSSLNTTAVGVITKVPSTNWNAETKTTLGHSQPKPEVVQFLMRLSLA